MYFSSEYERIIKNTNVKNPFEVISVNYPDCYDFPLLCVNIKNAKTFDNLLKENE